MKQIPIWLKLPGDTLIIMLIGIALTFGEVFMYSLFHPGLDQHAREAHANRSGPWISATTGFMLMFLFTRRFIIKHREHRFLYAIALPILYMVLDILVLLLLKTDPNGVWKVFLLSNGVKITGSLAAYFIFHGNQ